MAAFYAGLDVSDRTTAICVVDKAGELVWEGSEATDPNAIALALTPYRRALARVGFEAGVKAALLERGLAERRFPTVCLETRASHAALSIRRNKTDANDAHGIALLLCRGIYATAHVKSLEAMRTRALLITRKVLQQKAIDLHLTLRMTMKQFGVAVKKSRDRTLTCDPPRDLLGAVAPILRAYEAVSAEFDRVDKGVIKHAKADPVCMRLMTIPGVGPITALTFRSAIDDPARFSSSRNVAAHFGLTPRRFQSGELDLMGRITKRGDKTVRCMLFEAARTLICLSHSQSPLRIWAVNLAKRRGFKVAAIATARKLAVIMHRMWVTGRDFDGRAV